jgi:hypothetical protein
MQLDGGGDDDSGDALEAGADEAADTRALQADTGTMEATPQAAKPSLVVRVRGPAPQVVRILENEGISAEADSARVVIADALAVEVLTALGARPPGNVAVYVRR